jgi:hypothetical protein
MPKKKTQKGTFYRIGDSMHEEICKDVDKVLGHRLDDLYEDIIKHHKKTIKDNSDRAKSWKLYEFVFEAVMRACFNMQLEMATIAIAFGTEPVCPFCDQEFLKQDKQDNKKSRSNKIVKNKK